MWRCFVLVAFQDKTSREAPAWAPTTTVRSNDLPVPVLEQAVQHLRRSREYLLYKEDVKDIMILLLSYAPVEYVEMVRRSRPFW